ncbi:MAG: DUF3175 domain-containing protein [Pseudolabrys sp.]|nr:DUF3175 domain-containing protein [Pseudolabrys sp.]
MARTAKIRKVSHKTTHKTSHKSSTARRRKSNSKSKARGARRWSQRVTRESDALTLEEGVFTKSTPRKIALSLKRSADRSKRRKSDPYRSAMSMLTFYINRAGKGLSKTRKARLQKAKDELREVYGKG